MKIKKMTAAFGRLRGASLTPGPGLTVIHSPNEGGKSTWAAFLRAMLYGINTRERDREGHLAEKNRYSPWSGVPMEGELLLTWRGEDITLRRFAKRTGPFGGFEAVYAATGEPVPGLTAVSVGETLTGAGRELYERTAFVGQGDVSRTGGAELEERISTLAASGEEGVSFSEVSRTLKDWRNRRMANRANGLLPRLDREILETGEAIAALERAGEEERAALAALEELEAERVQLEAELDIHRRLRQQDLDRRYGQALLDYEKALEAVPQPSFHPVFGSMTAEEAWAFAQARAEARREAEEENRRVEEERAHLLAGAERSRRAMVLWGVLLAAALLLPTVTLLLHRFHPAGFLAFGLISVLCLAGLLRRRSLRGRAEGALKELSLVPVPEEGDLLAQAADYREGLARAEQAQAVADAARALADELAAQGGRPFTTLEFLRPPERAMAETAARLRAVEAEAARCRRVADMAAGKSRTLGDLDEHVSRLDSFEAERARRQQEYDALTAAMDALAAADASLRSRFSPALNRLAGEFFARLTGGAYAALSLTRAFDAAATPAGEILPRPALALSRGTAEQLYLAVRLAVCSLTLGGEEPPPLVLDDALANFDDTRAALALELLRELGEERQILLFTCHRRDAAWAEERGLPLLLLQSERE